MDKVKFIVESIRSLKLGSNEGYNHSANIDSGTASVACWSKFLDTDPEALGSIPGATIFSE
jgi:hypothetical protein